MVNKKELLDFEKWCVDTYTAGKLRSPLHLSGGNEKELIKIFKDIKPQDWIFTTYRSHYHALLKGVPKKWLKQWILDNKSIHVMNKEHKIITSAIVGGTLSQAVGCAMAIKLKQEDTEIRIKEAVKDLKGEDWKVDGEVIITPMNQPHVWAFCGDMTASIGVFHDCYEYARTNNLPITFVIEDNGLSTDTPTTEAWGYGPNGLYFKFNYLVNNSSGMIRYYKYERIYPHYGIGKFVAF